MDEQLPRIRRMALASFASVAMVLVAAGCGSEDNRQTDRDTGGWVLGDSGHDVGTDAGSDGGGDVGTDGGGKDEPWPMSFELVNTTDQTVRIRDRSGCVVREQEWVDLHDDGERMRTRETCGACSCETVEEDGGCPVCDCAATAFETVAPGESIEWQWSGYTYRHDSVDGQTCTRKAIPDRGSYEAEFCWESGPIPLDAPPRPNFDPTCETVSFEYGADRQVRHQIEDESTGEPKETTFRIHNDSDDDISIQSPANCSGGQEEWIQLEDGEQPIKMTSWCADCHCDQVEENGACPVCEVACVPTPPEVLKPGETAEFVWSGRAYRRGEKHGTACWRESVPSIGETIQAEFSWYPSGKRGTVSEQVTFDYGADRTIEHTVEGDDNSSRSPTTFRLVNDSSEPIRYQKSYGCTQPAWLEFADDSVKATGGNCGICKCEFLEREGRCPVCAAGRCQPPQIDVLYPGESTEWTWDGYVYKRDAVDGKTCHRKTVPPRGRNFLVDICWKRGDGPTGDGELEGETCIGRGFSYGDATTVIQQVE